MKACEPRPLGRGSLWLGEARLRPRPPPDPLLRLPPGTCPRGKGVLRPSPGPLPRFFAPLCGAGNRAAAVPGKAISLGEIAADCRKTPGELERAAALSNFQSCPAACTVGTGRFLRRKISFSRAKIVSLQAPRPKNLRFLAETGEGGSGGGACFPVHQLVKTFFDKLKRFPLGKSPPRRPAGLWEGSGEARAGHRRPPQ